jgi:hypothetical protein
MEGVYPEPDIMTSMLKVATSRIELCVVSVSVATAALLGASIWPCKFQLSVMGPLAVNGFQFAAERLNVTCAVPVFFTYTVRVTEPPGDIVPQLMDVSVWVQALSL